MSNTIETAPRKIAQLTAAELSARTQRNYAIAAALIVMVLIFFVVTLVHLGGNVASRSF